jgi:hypothetical protein
MKQSLEGSNSRKVPFFYCRPTPAPSAYKKIADHPKMWLIKYNRRKQGENEERIRVVISTCNLGPDDWERGTNIFWVG